MTDKTDRRRQSTPPQGAARADVYQRVTDAIVARLEQGTRPWSKPWKDGGGGATGRPLRANGQPYRGINVVVLWAAAAAKGYASPFWMTYKQAGELGGQVKKGERGTTVVYASTFVKKGEGSAGGKDGEDERVAFLKGYAVFNVAQIDGLPERFGTVAAAPATAGGEGGRIARAETFFAALGADVRTGSGPAYIPRRDAIEMPPFAAFPDPLDYYSTLAHECVHWTMHPARLDRDTGKKRWGDAGYAMEELVAELGGAFIAADLGLALTPRDDHAAYLASWLKVMKGDKRAIFTAAGMAQRAADYLHGLQPGADAGAEEAKDAAGDEAERAAA